jgi:predicted phosphodiesterase
VWKRVIEASIKKNPDAAFIVNSGDIVEDKNEAYLPFYFDYGQNVTGEKVFIYSMGNNDSVNWYESYFPVPPNGFRGILSSFDYGNAHFVNIDSNKKLNGEQLAWLDNDLKSSAQKWKVAITHEADYGRRGRNTAITKLFEKYNVHLVMAGHNHFYSRSKAIDAAGNEKPNGTVWTIPNTAGTSFNPVSGQPYLARDEQPNLPVFTEFRFTNNNIFLKAYTVDRNGNVSLVDQFTFN